MFLFFFFPAKSLQVRHHLEHVIKQARSLKNKSPEWRTRRKIPEDWDVSSVRVQVLPSTCERCNSDVGWRVVDVVKMMNEHGIVQNCYVGIVYIFYIYFILYYILYIYYIYIYYIYIYYIYIYIIYIIQYYNTLYC